MSFKVLEVGPGYSFEYDFSAVKDALALVRANGAKASSKVTAKRNFILTKRVKVYKVKGTRYFIEY